VAAVAGTGLTWTQFLGEVWVKTKGASGSASANPSSSMVAGARYGRSESIIHRLSVRDQLVCATRPRGAAAAVGNSRAEPRKHTGSVPQREATVRGGS
jgi:hypothetical protein